MLIKQILWPGGVFISKRPKQPPMPEGSTSGNNSNEILSPRSLEELQQQEADNRAKFVYDLMISMLTLLIPHLNFKVASH